MKHHETRRSSAAPFEQKIFAFPLGMCCAINPNPRSFRPSPHEPYASMCPATPARSCRATIRCGTAPEAAGTVLPGATFSSVAGPPVRCPALRSSSLAGMMLRRGCTEVQRLPLQKGTYALIHDQDGCEHVIQLGSFQEPRGRQITVLGGRLARHNLEYSGWFESELFTVLQITREDALATLGRWERERTVVRRMMTAALRNAGRLPRSNPPSTS